MKARHSPIASPLPQNLDAERAVLGAVLLDNSALNDAVENLRPEDFFLDQHRPVFAQMLAMSESQQAIDLVILTEELHRCGDLEAAGGAAYLASLADGLPRVSNVAYYARIVKEKSILRSICAPCGASLRIGIKRQWERGRCSYRNSVTV